MARALYSNEEFQEVCALVTRVRGHRLDKERLFTDLTDLLASKAKLTRPDEIWAELLEDEPDPKEWVRELEKLLKSDGPVDFATMDSKMRVKLRGMIRIKSLAKWRRSGHKDARPLQSNETQSISKEETDEVRNILQELLRSFCSGIKPGAPPNYLIDTFLVGVADMWLTQSNLRMARNDLPASQNSRFIKFAHAALKPALGKELSSHAALGQRWRRLVKHKDDNVDILS